MIKQVMNMKCIYCKNEIKETQQNREHIFPKSFGCPDSWFLDCVCKNCNHKLGGTIERFLAGDSLESLRRLKYIGSRSKKSIKQIRLKINIPREDKYGKFAGATVYTDFSQRNKSKLPTQILIQDDEKNRKIFFLDDIEKDEIKEEIHKYKNKNICIIFENEENKKQALDKLKNIDVDLKIYEEGKMPEGVVENNEIIVEVKSIIDIVILRAIAKIAFNYLTLIKGSNYVLDSRFDPVREFITKGIKPKYEIVKLKEGHILTDETNHIRFLNGHIFTIRIEGNSIISEITLFNSYTYYYYVYLGELGPIWHNIKSGHAYRFKDNKIIELFSPTFIITPYSKHFAI